MKKNSICRLPEISFEIFLSLWNATQGYTTPVIHFRMASWLRKCWETGEKRLLLQAFRGSGKSTLIGLFSAWALYRDPDLRILVLAAESTLARKMVRAIRKIIEKHPLTKTLRPKRAEEWAADSFTVRRARTQRDPSVLARSLFSNITGSRADIIIYDDVEVPNTCYTPGKREDLRDRLSESLFILVPGGLQIFVGTPHHWHTIYADAPRTEAGEEDIFLKDYTRLTIPILDESGESTWPERFTGADIMNLKRQNGPNAFASQMMLVPVNATEGRLDITLLRRYAGELDYSEANGRSILRLEGRRLVSCKAWWDPAFGSDRGDKSVLAVVYTDEEGDYWLHRIAYLKPGQGSETDEATYQCRQVVALVEQFYIPSIALETNGIGGFLPGILKRELGLRKVAAAVLERHSRKAKDTRILEAFDAPLAAQALHVHASVYETPFIGEMQEWRPGVNGADDGIDAAAGAISLEPVRLKRVYPSRIRPSWRGAGTHQAQTEFEA